MALLQSTLLPAVIPPIPGVQIAARYLPVEDTLEVGGDFYDVFQRSDRRTFGLSIGDVSGKGISAASLTALARHTIRAVSRRTNSPAKVLAELNDAILADDNADRYLTVAHLVLKPDGAATRVNVALGGHPAPLLRSANRSIRPIGHPGSPVGLLTHDAAWTEEQVSIGAGNVLVMFTDGLTDLRHPTTGDLAEPLVSDVLARSDADNADALADELLEAALGFAGGKRRDDIALLVIVPDAGQ